MVTSSARTKSMIELRGLYRFFGRTRAVNGVSFEVHPGQVFGYIGPNGAGKTTSMRILATLDLPNYGDAYVDGFSVINDPDRVRRRLGFMPDYYGTYANCNVFEYLDFFARAYGLKGKERRDALTHVMGFTKLDQMRDKPINGLSKGMKQRLCLGRTMVHNPGVLILDEPAAGLDPRARIELREMIRELADNGKTILVSSHILTELAEMCDTVGIIEKGELLAIGSIDDILDKHRREVMAQQTHRIVQMQVLGETSALIHWLVEREDIDKVNVERDLITFEHTGDLEADANLLKQLVDSGFRVTMFGSRAESLEDVFLEVTQGRVQ